MRSERFVDERVGCREHVGYRGIRTKRVEDETIRLFFHRLRQFGGELGEQVGIDLVVFEVVVVEPARGEVFEQGLCARVAEHALDLRDEPGIAHELSRSGSSDKQLVGHGSPERIR
jgi:hypothetical protein